MAKKVLCINWGTLKGNNRRCLEIAAKGAEAAGCEVEIVDTINMKISRCIGCGVCSRTSRVEGAATIECVVKDDFQVLREKLLNSDAIICACPVYALAPTGQYKNFVDRLGPANDFAQTTKEAMKRRSMVADPEKPGELIRMDQSGQIAPLDPRVYRRRPIAYIACGGAREHHWISLTLPMMKFLGYPIGCFEVDELEVYGGSRPSDERIEQLGRNLGEAAGKHYTRVPFKGDKEGVCPVCHCDFINFNEGRGTEVECPVCGITGQLTIKDGAIEVEFPVDEWDNSRMMFQGLVEHANFGTLVSPRRR